MKNIYRILTFVMCMGLLSQCAQDGEYDHPINHDNFPDVMIMFPQAATAGANPYYKVSVPAGSAQAAIDAIPFSISIGVQEGSPHQITQITKVLAGTTGITAGGVASAVYTAPIPVGSVLAYVNAPIAVSGTGTITTTIGALNAFITGTANDVTLARIDAVTTGTPLTPYLEYAFMFVVTLDDNTTVIPQQVRIRFLRQ